MIEWFANKISPPPKERPSVRWNKSVDACLEEYGSYTALLEAMFEDDYLDKQATSPIVRVIYGYLKEQHKKKTNDPL